MNAISLTKTVKVLLVGCVGLSALFISCNTRAQNPANSTEQLFKDNPVSISWADKNAEIDSYSADVEVYSKNNRTNSVLSKTDAYRITYKKIDGVSYSRVDLDKEYNGGVSRAVITDGKEMVVVNNDDNAIEARLPVNQEDDNGIGFLTASPITGRVNIPDIKTNAARLSLDLTEDKESGSMTISLPSSLFPEQNGVTRVSTKIRFDTTTETLSEVEIVTLDEEGVTVTTSTESIYEECNGELIKVGTITIIDTQNPNLVEGFSEDYPVYESLDDIPEISEAELLAMQETGNIYEDTSITFGDPADLSNVETIVELYNYVEINEVSDAAFRALLGDE